jgi:CRP-like cAMP-binding protein
MSDEDIRLLRLAGSELHVPAGRLLTERGHPGAGLFVILDGSVLVEAPEGRRELGAGTVVGERALLAPNGLRTARVRAATDVRALAIGRSAFDRLAATEAGLRSRVAAAAA